MLTHWVVDDNHAQACPEASRYHMCKQELCVICTTARHLYNRT